MKPAVFDGPAARWERTLFEAVPTLGCLAVEQQLPSGGSLFGRQLVGRRLGQQLTGYKDGTEAAKPKQGRTHIHDHITRAATSPRLPRPTQSGTTQTPQTCASEYNAAAIGPR